jgi:hypothetical protein
MPGKKFFHLGSILMCAFYTIYTSLAQFICVNSSLPQISNGGYIEIEARDGILERYFSRVFSDASLCLVFYPHFPFYKWLFLNRLKFSYFADFFVRIFKTREESVILLYPPVEETVNSMEQKTRVFC